MSPHIASRAARGLARRRGASAGIGGARQARPAAIVGEVALSYPDACVGYAASIRAISADTTDTAPGRRLRLAIAFSEARSAIGNEALFRRWVASETSYEMAYVDVLLSLARHSLPAQATPRRIF